MREMVYFGVEGSSCGGRGSEVEVGRMRRRTVAEKTALEDGAMV